MGLTVCPTGIVAAPLAVVWGNLVQWERYAGWAGVQPERVEPAGPAAPGQTIHFAGKVLWCTMRFIGKVEAIDPDRHQIDLHGFFPLGLQQKAHIVCTPIDAASCRVQYG